MGRPQFTSSPEAYSERKFWREVLLVFAGVSFGSTLSIYSYIGSIGPVVTIGVTLILIFSARYVDKSATE